MAIRSRVKPLKLNAARFWPNCQTQIRFAHSPPLHIHLAMLYVIGLGLSDERDITVKGLDAVKSCERIYLEAYTSILMVDKEKLVRYSSPLSNFE